MKSKFFLNISANQMITDDSKGIGSGDGGVMPPPLTFAGMFLQEKIEIL